MLCKVMILINSSVKLHIDGFALQRAQKFFRILAGQFRKLLSRHFFFVLVPVLESFARLTFEGDVFGSCDNFIFHWRIVADFVELFYDFPHRLKVRMQLFLVVIENLCGLLTCYVSHIFDIFILFELAAFAYPYFSHRLSDFKWTPRFRQFLYRGATNIIGGHADISNFSQNNVYFFRRI